MDEATRQALITVESFIDYLLNSEYHDRQLVAEGVQSMLSDLIKGGQLKDLELYIRRYTRLDPLEASAAAAAIFANVGW